MKPKHRILSLVASIFLGSIGSISVHATDLNSSINDFLAKNFPYNHFIPTPYGADNRYAVRTIWVQLDNVQKSGRSPGKAKAWVAFSDGLSVYPDSAVNVRHDPVDLRTLTLDSTNKWALAASLAGNISQVPIDGSLDFARTNDLDIEMNLGTVEIEYAFVADLLLSQKIHQQNLDALTELIRGRSSDLPPLRVISASLRVKNANLSVKKKTGTSAGLDLKVAQILTSFGLHYNGEKDSFESLTISDWKYIAFEALIADRKTGKISTGKEIPADLAVDPTWNTQLLPDLLGVDK